MALRFKQITVLLTFVVSVSFTKNTLAQSLISMKDIDNFWLAYDKVVSCNDSAMQVKQIQGYYLDLGTAGLKEFIKLRDWKASSFRESIIKHRAFWNTVRAKTEKVSTQIPDLKQLLSKFHEIYPPFKTPQIYFVIGFIETGGTTTQDKVLLGTEILTADSTVNADGLHPMLQTFFQSKKDITGLIAHELTHTQQKGGDMETKRKTNLLGFCIAEGACDFIAELLIGKSLVNPYLVYGREHEKELWPSFKSQMHSRLVKDWLYNGGLSDVKNADLGYYVGYAICKSFYQNARDKSKAVSDIITLDLEDLNALDSFVEMSGYLKQVE